MLHPHTRRCSLLYASARPSLKSQPRHASMSAGSGLPVQAYTACSSTWGNAMWHDCGAGEGGEEQTNSVWDRLSAAWQDASQGAAGAAPMPPRQRSEQGVVLRVYETSKQGCCAGGCSHCCYNGSTPPWAHGPTGAHVPARTCRMLSERRMSPLPSSTSASRPPVPSDTLQGGRVPGVTTGCKLHNNSLS